MKKKVFYSQKSEKNRLTSETHIYGDFLSFSDFQKTFENTKLGRVGFSARRWAAVRGGVNPAGAHGCGSFFLFQNNVPVRSLFRPKSNNVRFRARPENGAKPNRNNVPNRP